MTIDEVQPVTAHKWYEIWWNIWGSPGVATFESLLSEPDHTTRRGFIWIAITSWVVAIITGLTSTTAIQSGAPALYNNVLALICAIIFIPVGAILGLVISTAIYHGIARLVGGQGTWSDLLICVSAVVAPGELVGAVVALFTFLAVAIPGLIFLPWVISVVFGIYGMVLYIIALKAAEKLSTGKAVLTYFIPTIIIGLLVVCALLALIPAFRTTLQ